MAEFEQALLRLKEQLGIPTNKAVGELLGLQEKAFNARKRRGSFPEKELRALVQQRPDLGIDVDYVLTGRAPVEAKGAWLRLKAQLGLDDDAAVAEWLGMQIAEVNAYTRRGAFPTQQFLAACKLRSDPVDQDYVLTGVGAAATSIIADSVSSVAAGSNPGKERQVIQLYRSDLVFRSAIDAVLALAQSKGGGGQA